MKKNINFKKIKLFIFYLAIFAFITLNITSIQATETTELNIKESYLVGEQIKLPEKVFDESGIEGNPIIIYPNGTAYSRKEIELSLPGKYELRYDFYKNNKVVNRKQYFFDVNQKTYNVIGDGSVDLENGQLNVSLGEGAKLIINQLIPVSKLMSEDSFINLDIIPKQYNVIDFNRIEFKIIDSLNKDNYIFIGIRNSSDSLSQPNPEPYKQYSYGLAGASFQSPSGFEQSVGIIHRNNEWGSSLPLSFWGLENKTNLKLILNQEKEVYANNQFIIDLDDSSFFPKTWEGFDSEYVNIEIQATDYMGDKANFVINEIVTIDFKKSLNRDNDVYKINIDYDETLELIALQNKPFEIFKATGYINGLKTKVYFRIYEDYDNPYLRSEVSVSNNQFIPTKKGKYTIVYSIFNEYQEEYKKIINITSKENVSEINLSVTTKNRVNEGYVGEVIPISNFSYSGGIGKLNYEVLAVSSQETIILNDAKHFIPSYSGEYTIIYTIKDYINRTKAYSYKVDVDYSDETILETHNINMPQKFDSGYTYDLPKIKAYLYKENVKTETDVTITALLDGQIIEVNNNQVTIPEVSSVKTIKITYESMNSIKTYDVLVYPSLDNDNNINFANFFDYEKGQVLTEQSGTVISTNEDSKFTFNRELVISGFSMYFQIYNKLNDLNSLDIILTDSFNENEKIRISLFKENEKIMIRINNTKPKIFEIDISNVLQLFVEDNGIYFSNTFYQINNYENGEINNGFSSGSFRISIEFKGVKTPTSVNIESISKQSLKKGAIDNMAPQIYILGNHTLLSNIDEIKNVPKAVSKDVINPNVLFYLSVKNSTGDYLTSTDGLLLKEVDPLGDYQIKLTNYGEYVIEYVSIDTLNNRMASRNIRFIVENKVIPQFSLTFNMKTEAKVFEKIAVASFKLKESEKEKYFMVRSLVLPNGNDITLDDKYDSFIPTEEGTYVIRYYIIDQDGNFNIKEHQINVSK